MGDSYFGSESVTILQFKQIMEGYKSQIKFDQEKDPDIVEAETNPDVYARLTKEQMKKFDEKRNATHAVVAKIERVLYSLIINSLP